MAPSGSGEPALEVVHEPQAKLDLLLEELRLCVEGGGAKRVSGTRQNFPRAERLLARAPLAHGMREVRHLLSALQGGALLSREQLRMPLLPSEQYLGFRDVVYTSAGVFYPDRRIALVFSASAEDNIDVTASPWDTGSFFSSERICPGVPLPPAADRRELFDKTCLPAPLYRRYLVHYVASCYGTPEDYLSQNSHRYADPNNAMTDKWQSRVFEVRFHERLPLREGSLLAAFVPKYAGDRESLALREFLEPLAARSVHIQTYDNYARLGPVVRAWIHKHVRQEASS